MTPPPLWVALMYDGFDDAWLADKAFFTESEGQAWVRRQKQLEPRGASGMRLVAYVPK